MVSNGYKCMTTIHTILETSAVAISNEGRNQFDILPRKNKFIFEKKFQQGK